MATPLPPNQTLRLPEQIVGAAWKTIDDEDVVEYKNVFVPDKEVYRCATGALTMPFFVGERLPLALLARIDRFHDPATIHRFLNERQDNHLDIADKAKVVFQSTGEGISMQTWKGYHSMRTSYLLVHRDDPLNWVSFSQVARTIEYYRGEICYNISDVTIWAKRDFDRAGLYCLAGASLGYLLGLEVMMLANQIGRRSEIRIGFCCEDIVDGLEEAGVSKMTEEFLFVGLNQFATDHECRVRVGEIVMERS